MVVEVARLLEDDREALITEVAAIRLEWAQEAARALEATEPKKAASCDPESGFM